MYRLSTRVTLLPLLLFLQPAAALAQAPRLVVRGFVSTTMYAQDAAFGFGNGQNALWVKGSDPGTDPWLLGTDIRNSRLTFDIAGGELVPGTSSAATLEFDFFGGFAGNSATGDEQPLPRLRLAQVDLKRGATTLRIGQSWTPLIGYLPVSTSHVAFPLGLGSAGIVGWRSPGIYLLHTFRPAGLPPVNLHAGVFRGSWNGPGDVLDQLSAGETSAVPQVEARLEVGGARAAAYLAGHFDRKDLNGMAADTGAVTHLTGKALAFGARVTLGSVKLVGSGYTGRAIGQQLGQLAQFGDIGSTGGWVQASYQLSPRWSSAVFAGAEDPDDADLRREIAGDQRRANRLGGAMLQYTIGDYSAGIEWMGARTEWGRGADATTARTAHQLSFSVLYRFDSTSPVVQ